MESETPTVVLACAPPIEPAAREIAAQLQDCGFEARVLCGALAETVLLGRSVESADGPAIHVVCVSGALEDRKLWALRNVLEKRARPGQHMVVAEIDPDDPCARVPEIIEVMATVALPLRQPLELPSLKPESQARRLAPAAAISFGLALMMVGAGVAIHDGPVAKAHVTPSVRMFAKRDVEPLGQANRPEPESRPRRIQVPVSSTDASELSRAVARRQILELDRVHVARSRSPELDWYSARLRCRGLEVGGVSDWRLPTQRELRLLDAVGVLGTKLYWSRTFSRYDRDAVWVRDAGDGRDVTRLREEADPRAICVRKR